MTKLIYAFLSLANAPKNLQNLTLDCLLQIEMSDAKEACNRSYRTLIKSSKLKYISRRTGVDGEDTSVTAVPP
jgi:hypothetical protein